MDTVGESTTVRWNNPEDRERNPCQLLPTDALRMPLFSLQGYYAITEYFSNSCAVFGPSGRKWEAPGH